MRMLIRDDRGQAMVIVALACVALLGALALAVDWGYGLTQRRVMQASAEAAALSAGKYLATSVVRVDGEIAFTVTQEEVWCLAERYVESNDAFRPSDAAPDLVLEFGSDTSPTTWTDVPAPVGGCPTAGVSAVPADTIYVRAVTTVTYRSLVAGILGFPTTTAAASARAKLSGTPVPTGGPVWPMVRHYDPSDFDLPCPARSCDPSQLDIPPTTFWSPQEDDVVYGNFKGLVDFARHSSRLDPLAPQLIESWDDTGSAAATPPTPLKEDWSGNCGASWDTAGGETPQLHGKQCSIPNWFYYTFQGALSLDRDWSSTVPSGQEIPSALTARALCDGDPDRSPSCADPRKGDWVETAFGDIGTNMSDNMRALIHEKGFTGPFSGEIIASGPNKGERYGKALVVLVYLWDCAESYDRSAPAGDQWSLILDKRDADCSQVPRTGSAPAPDRVHLFAAAPFTFYEGLVSSQAIQGYWGGAFGDPGSCQDCALNPLANTTFLVADDDPP